MSRLVLGTRGSALALAQTRLVRQALRHAHPDLDIEVKTITTSGDRRQDVTAGEGSDAGLKGLFTKEIQEALLDRSIDAAVHSLKDLPGITPPALGFAAVLPRADTSDLLISSTYPSLAALPPGARIGTGSIRRSRQLQWKHPGLRIVDLRGNVPTRLQKLATLGLDAIVLARAGLERLGYTISGAHLECDAGSFHATPLDILPAIGQGAIGIESRRDDPSTNALLAPIDHPPTHLCIRVERELLRLLDGDCRLPVAARATLAPSGLLQASALVFRDGIPAPAQAHATGKDPESIAADLFRQLYIAPSQ
ncbi:MAG: hydroxymethylbilane synthase [Chthoniobacteraceae bacterium]|jgi:hydroxymethylbilane synthase